MKSNILTKKSAAIFVFSGVTAILAPSAYAQSVSVTFDQLSVPSGTSLTGAPVTDYLAGYGITLSGMSSGTAAYVTSAVNQPYAVPASAPNFFEVSGGGSVRTFTLDFAGLIDNFSFTRVGMDAAFSPSGSILGSWSATAYDASNVSLASVGEGLFSTFGSVPMQTFTLSALGIDHISFTGNHFGFAGSALPRMDDFTYSSVAAIPEPETYAMLLAGLGMLGFAARRRKLKEAATA